MSGSEIKYPIKISKKEGKQYIFDNIRKKNVRLTPEEWVRQNFIKYLVEEKKYPQGLIGIEQKIPGKTQKQRTDIIIYSKKAEVLMIIECKAESVKITQDVFDQAARYNMQYNTSYLVLTNGKNHYICKINTKEKSYAFLKELPEYGSLKVESL